MPDHRLGLGGGGLWLSGGSGEGTLQPSMLTSGLVLALRVQRSRGEPASQTAWPASLGSGWPHTPGLGPCTCSFHSLSWEGAVDEEVRARLQSSSFLRNRLAHTLLLGRPALDLLESARDHGRGLPGLPPTLACPSHGRRKVQSMPCPTPAPWTTPQHPPSELSLQRPWSVLPHSGSRDTCCHI